MCHLQLHLTETVRLKVSMHSDKLTQSTKTTMRMNNLRMAAKHAKEKQKRLSGEVR